MLFVKFDFTYAYILFGLTVLAQEIFYDFIFYFTSRPDIRCSA